MNTEARGQFHQSSMPSFYVRKLRAQLFSAYVLGLYFTGATLQVQKLCVERWWNWTQVSISPTLYEQLFHKTFIRKLYVQLFVYLKLSFILLSKILIPAFYKTWLISTAFVYLKSTYPLSTPAPLPLQAWTFQGIILCFKQSLPIKCCTVSIVSSVIKIS